MPTTVTVNTFMADGTTPLPVTTFKLVSIGTNNTYDLSAAIPEGGASTFSTEFLVNDHSHDWYFDAFAKGADGKSYTANIYYHPVRGQAQTLNVNFKAATTDNSMVDNAGHALSASAVGEIVGSDGKAYAVADKNYMPSGVTAVAMVAYKSGSNGLAIQLNGSPSKMSWSDANAYTGYPTISGNVGTWRLPSEEDWINMFTGCAIDGDGLQSNNPNPDPLYYISGFMEKIAATGTTWVKGGYWSSTTTGTGSDTKYGYVDTNFSDSPTNHYYAYINKMLKSNADTQSVQFYVLGCLAF